jgi:hypothetical protein
VQFSDLSGCAAMMLFFMRKDYILIFMRQDYWTRLWAILQKEKDRSSLKYACCMLETVAMEVCAKHGWLSYSRISL